MWKAFWKEQEIIGMKFRPFSEQSENLSSAKTSRKNIYFCRHFMVKIHSIITTITNDLILIDKKQCLSNCCDSLTKNEYASIYQSVGCLSQIKAQMNNELSRCNAFNKETDISSFSPFNFLLNSADQCYYKLKDKNIILIVERFENFPCLVKSLYNSYWSFFMTLFEVFANQVSNAEIKIECDGEKMENSNDYCKLNYKIIIEMNNPSGIPPTNGLFDDTIPENLDPASFFYNEDLPDLLKGIYSYISLFSMAVDVQNENINKGNYTVKSVIYSFKFIVDTEKVPTHTTIMNTTVMNFN